MLWLRASSAGLDSFDSCLSNKWFLFSVTHHPQVVPSVRYNLFDFCASRQEVPVGPAYGQQFHPCFHNCHIGARVSRRLLRHSRRRSGCRVTILFLNQPIDYVLLPRSRLIHNKLMHILHGNTVLLCLEDLLFRNNVYDRQELLNYRSATPPQIHTGICLADRGKRRTGKRLTKWTSVGHKLFFRPPKFKGTLSNSKQLGNPHELTEFIPVQQPSPPPKGAPGAPHRSDEECNPTEGQQFPSSFTRAVKRRLYRFWKRKAGFHAGVSVGNWRLVRPQPLKAAHRKHHSENRSEGFFKHVLTPLGHMGGPGPHHPHVGPPEKLPYASSLKLGSLNVQGPANQLKHQLVLQYMSNRNLDILILTETRAKLYHSFSSQSYKFVVNGSPDDPYAGISAIISPLMLPFIKDIVQLTPRILQISLYSHSGTIHLIGIYAPHAGLSYDFVRAPFWDKLHDLIAAIPQPEPWYVIGDFNVRLQGRLSTEFNWLGPHIFGKGPLKADTSPFSNRTLYLHTLQLLQGKDVMSFKTPRLLRQITYQEKTPVALSWAQFAGDPLIIQQFFGHVFFPLGEDGIDFASHVRSFLFATPLPPASASRPILDPKLFHSLDKCFTVSKWLLTVLNMQAYHDFGFPSDHFPTELTFRVKLRQPSSNPGSALKKALAYPTSSADPRLHAFNTTFRSFYSSPTIAAPAPPTRGSLTIFTDGSGDTGRCSSRTPAGWGWTGSFNSRDFFDSAGPVQVHPSDPGFLGARVGSNNTAELSAWMEAALFLLAQPEALPADLTFVYDSKWTAHMVTGHWRPKRHKAMISLARALYLNLSSKICVHWVWVKGHSGNVGNERADCLAQRGRNSPAAFGGRYSLSRFPLSQDFLSSTASTPTSQDALEQESQLLTSAIVHSALSSFASRTSSPRKPWITQSTLDLITQARRAHQLNSPESSHLWKQAKKSCSCGQKTLDSASHGNR